MNAVLVGTWCEGRPSTESSGPKNRNPCRTGCERFLLSLAMLSVLFLASLAAGCGGIAGTLIPSTTPASLPQSDTSVAPSQAGSTAPTSEWKFSAADLTLAEKTYARQIGLRLYMLVDAAWSLDPADMEKMFQGDFQTIDRTKLENITSLALFSYVEANSGTAPTSRLEPFRTAFGQVLLPYAKALSQLDWAVNAADKENATTWLAGQTLAFRDVGDFARQLTECGNIEMPALPTKGQLTSEEEAFVFDLLESGAALETAMIEAQKAVEAGGSSQQLASQLASQKAAVLKARSEWQSKAVPSERLYETGARWNLMLSYEAAGLGTLSGGGPDERSRLADSRVLLRLAGVLSHAVFADVQPLL